MFFGAGADGFGTILQETKMSSWMNSAVKHPGALTRKAKAAGESVQQFAHQHAHSKGKTGQQARLALAFAKFRKGKDDTPKKSPAQSLYGDGN